MATSIILAVLMLTASAVAQDDEGTCPSDNACFITDGPVERVPTTGSSNHFYIGGFFGMHEQGDVYKCGDLSAKGLVQSEAFFWAIRRYANKVGYNSNVASSDNVYAGGFVLDTCNRQQKAIESAMSFETCRRPYKDVHPRNTVAYVGLDSDEDTAAIANLFNELERTQVSATAKSIHLSDDMYKYLLRSVPSSKREMQVLADFLASISIKYVQVLYDNDMHGKSLFAAFKERAEAKDICITNMMHLNDSDLPTVMESVKENEKTKYVVLLSSKPRMVLQAADTAGLGEKLIFIGSWGSDKAVIEKTEASKNAISIQLNSDGYFNAGDVDQFYKDFKMMKPNHDSSTTNKNDYNPMFTQYWEKQFSCSFQTSPTTCTDTMNKDLSALVAQRDPSVPYILLAVDSIMRGVKKAAADQCTGAHFCSNLLNVAVSRGDIFYKSIRGAVNSAGDRFYDDDGDANEKWTVYKVFQVLENNTYHHLYNGKLEGDKFEFDLLPGRPVVASSECKDSPCIQCGEKPAEVTTLAPQTDPTTVARPMADPQVALGMLVDRYFERDQEFTGIWRNQMREGDDWKTRFAIGQQWIIAVGVLAGVGIVCVLVFEIYILYKLMGTKIGKQWRTMWLGQLLLFGLFLCFLVCFAYLFIPTKATCGIIRFGYGVSVAICFAVLLVKLMVLLTSKTSADTLIPGDVDSPNYLRGVYQFLMFLFVVGVQVVIAAHWLITVPPEAVQVYSNNGDKVWICNHYTWKFGNLSTWDDNAGWEDMTNFVRNNFENHLLSLVYVLFLILLTTIIAMKAHGIITNHRESVFIGIAAGFCIPVWIAWTLVGGLNKNHAYAQEFGDACEVFGLFITATLIMFAMFLPKVRQLVNMGVEGIYLEDDRDTYYGGGGSVIMAPPSYKSKPPSSVMYVNNNGFTDSVIVGDQNAVHLKHPGSTYSAPVYMKRADTGTLSGTGKVLKMTGDLTGKPPRDSRKSTSEIGYGYAGSGYGTYKKPRSESGGTMRRARSTQDLGAL